MAWVVVVVDAKVWLPCSRASTLRNSTMIPRSITAEISGNICSESPGKYHDTSQYHSGNLGNGLL